MSLTLQYPTRCADCGLKMEAGEEYVSSTSSEGKWLRTHVECPERKPTRGQNLPQAFDVENLFHARKCTACMELWSFRKPSPPPPTCPSCGGKWLYGDPDKIAWAA